MNQWEFNLLRIYRSGRGRRTNCVACCEIINHDNGKTWCLLMFGGVEDEQNHMPIGRADTDANEKGQE